MNNIKLICSVIHELKKIGCNSNTIRQVFRNMIAYGPLRQNNLKHFIYNGVNK